MTVYFGDAQYDSPGFTAKYCTYSIMHCTTNEIVDFCVIQRGQFTGELKRQACQLLLDIKLDIGDFVTDRHTGIRAMMRKFSPQYFTHMMYGT